ncbi:MAG: hypothetical protein CMJ28_07630 [Phycisphaerae bacterium]|nr:hypothetical protein [Phycisphaerae bacterium]
MTIFALLLCILLEPPQSVPATPLVPMKKPIAAPEVTKVSSEFPTNWFYTKAGKRYDDNVALEGKPLPKLALENWRGAPVDVNNNQGKVMVIDFWATWCGPCRKALPKNVEMANKYKDQPFVLIGIHDARRGKDRIEQVVKPLKAEYPMAVDVMNTETKSGTSAKACRLRYWPTYLVVDHKGIVRACGLQPSRVEDVVKRLLAEISQDQPISPAPLPEKG